MDENLYRCALDGDVETLKGLLATEEGLEANEMRRRLLESEEKLKAKDSKGNNVLHIAAIYGHVSFAREVLNAKLELLSELNEAGVAPIHLAASYGHVDLVKLLLAEDPDLCILKDKHGRVPVHTAAIRGRVDVLKEIIFVNPWCLTEKTDKEETVLHLCVKERRTEVVEYLKRIDVLQFMVGEVDCNGNTPLHLAAARNQLEIIRIIRQIGTRGQHYRFTAYNKYKVTPSELLQLRGNQNYMSDDIIGWLLFRTAHRQFLRTKGPKTGSLMVVAILIATVTFQAAITPPGGFWQEDSASSLTGAIRPNKSAVINTDVSLTRNQTAGAAILRSTAYDRFMAFDTCAFVLSLFVIFYLLFLKRVPAYGAFVLLSNLVYGYVYLATVALGGAFYYAIHVTEPAGSRASKFIGIFLLAFFLSIPLAFSLWFYYKNLAFSNESWSRAFSECFQGHIGVFMHGH